MPWVFKRHWPVIGIQMMDWYGQPVAPYYYLKRTYEPTHVALDLDRLLFRPADTVALMVKIAHAHNQIMDAAELKLALFDDKFDSLHAVNKTVRLAGGPSVTTVDLGHWIIPKDYVDRFLFVLVELRNRNGTLLSRSWYHPRSLSLFSDRALYDKYRSEPIPWITLEKGPRLKETIANTRSRLQATLLSHAQVGDLSNIRIAIKNTSKQPSFMTKVDINGVKRAFYADDNYFWLSPGEQKEIDLKVTLRERPTGNGVDLSVLSWNAVPVHLKIKIK